MSHFQKVLILFSVAFLFTTETVRAQQNLQIFLNEYDVVSEKEQSRADSTNEDGNNPPPEPPSNNLFSSTYSNCKNQRGTCFFLLGAKDFKSGSALWGLDKNSLGLLESASLSSNGGSGSSTIEIVSDFIGPFKLSLAGIVADSNNEDDKDDARVQSFVSGGGNAVISGTIVGPGALRGKARIFSLITTRLGLDMPALGSSANATSANFDIGLDFLGFLDLSRNELGLVSETRLALVTGGKDFYEAVGVEDNFGYMKVSFGLSIPKMKAILLWSKILAGPSKIREQFGAGKISLVLTRV